MSTALSSAQSSRGASRWREAAAAVISRSTAQHSTCRPRRFPTFAVFANLARFPLFTLPPPSLQPHCAASFFRRHCRSQRSELRVAAPRGSLPPLLGHASTSSRRSPSAVNVLIAVSVHSHRLHLSRAATSTSLLSPPMPRRSSRSSIAPVSAVKPAKAPTKAAAAKRASPAAAASTAGGGRQTRLQLTRQSPAKRDDENEEAGDEQEEEEDEREEKEEKMQPAARPSAAARGAVERKEEEDGEDEDPYALPEAPPTRSLRPSTAAAAAVAPSSRVTAAKKAGKSGAVESGDLERLLQLVDAVQQWKSSSTKEALLKTVSKAAEVLVDYRALASSPTPSTAGIPSDHRPLLRTIAKALVQKSVLHHKADDVHNHAHLTHLTCTLRTRTLYHTRGSSAKPSSLSAASAALLLPRRRAAHLRTQPPVRRQRDQGTAPAAHTLHTAISHTSRPAFPHLPPSSLSSLLSPLPL